MGLLLWQAVLLGIIEGLTEFLPVSSSGHLALGHLMFGEVSESSLAFDVLVKFTPLEFDGKPYPPKKTQVSNGEQTMLGSEMSATNGFKLLKGTPITVLLLGHKLTKGDHRIKFEFEAKAVGVLKFEVTDAA